MPVDPLKELHVCLQIAKKETDFMFGAGSPILFETRLSNADWEPYLPDFDLQKERGIETDACVPFSATESIETQINFLIQSGKVPYAYMKALNDLGFLDEHDHFEASERFTAKMDGTTANGTSMTAPWDAVRKYGLLPYKDWPFDAKVLTFAEFYSTIPQALQDKAKEFLKYFDVSYEWIVDGTNYHPIADLKKHLAHAPLCIGSPACQPWNQVQPFSCPSVNPDHSTMVYRVDHVVHILDHYNPFKKNLGLDYNIPYVLKGVVIVKPVPFVPAPTIENVLPTQQNVSILQAIVSLYQKLIALFQRSQIQPGTATVFINSSKFWNWIMVSSQDPNAVATTAKGAVALVVPLLLVLLHNPNYSTLPDQVYAIVVTAFGVISAAVACYGLIMKLWRTATGTNLATAAYARAVANQ